MIIYYDPIHDACSVEFDEEDNIFMNVSENGGIEINSCKGGRPVIIEKQLLYHIEDLEAL